MLLIPLTNGNTTPFCFVGIVIFANWWISQQYEFVHAQCDVQSWDIPWISGLILGLLGTYELDPSNINWDIMLLIT